MITVPQNSAKQQCDDGAVSTKISLKLRLTFFVALLSVIWVVFIFFPFCFLLFGIDHASGAFPVGTRLIIISVAVAFLVLLLISILGSTYIIRKYIVYPAKRLVNTILDSTPLPCQLWDCSLNTLDCNEAAIKLFGFKDKKEYLDRFFQDCSPEFQPDGQNSVVKAKSLVKRAFDEGQVKFDWMHQLPDGSQLPSVVRLIRVNYISEHLIAGYIIDMRDMQIMKSKVIELEAIADAIYYDALTGIYNRRFFDENIKSIVENLSHSESVMSLMMVDIDFFKRYNDTYGHAEGDVCLRLIAESLSKSILRLADFVARYGGEEFVVVLPNTNEDGARIVAERMLDGIRALAVPHENSDAAEYVTVSIGIAVGFVKLGVTSGHFVELSDKMLYEAKNSGRNKYLFGHMPSDFSPVFGSYVPPHIPPP